MNPTTEPYRVLVVDDEPIVHSMIERILDGCSLPLTLAGTAISGPEALEAAKRLKPHICLLDIQMAEMNGFELADRLSETLDYQPVIIYVTADRKFDYAQQAIRLGAMDYIVKPIRRENVLKALSRAVTRIQAERLERLERDRLKESLESVLPATVSDSGPAGKPRRSSVAQTAREYADRRYGQKISLSTAAEYLNLSPGYLGPLFKAEYGISFKAYLRRVRITRAKELMRDQRLNLTEIAQKVGYEDISYFSQSFVDETGVRPSEYRGGGKHCEPDI